MIYLLQAACDKLKLSPRHLSRFAGLIGKKPTRIGTKIRFLFTDNDLRQIAELRKMRNPNKGKGARLPIPKSA